MWGLGQHGVPHNPAGCTETWECRVLVHISVQGKTMVDVGFWGGMVPANSHNASELRAMLDAGALGFKSFFSPSGGWFYCNATRILGLLLQPNAPPFGDTCRQLHGLPACMMLAACWTPGGNLGQHSAL